MAVSGRRLGKGYATEAASACLVYARQVFGIKEIYAFTSTLNERSERVMKKIGMRFIKTFDHPSVPCGHPLVPHKLYCTVRPDSRRRSLFAPATGTHYADRSDAVAIFVNGYWNTGRTALKIGSMFSHRLGAERFYDCWNLRGPPMGKLRPAHPSFLGI